MMLPQLSCPLSRISALLCSRRRSPLPSSSSRIAFAISVRSALAASIGRAKRTMIRRSSVWPPRLGVCAHPTKRTKCCRASTPTPVKNKHEISRGSDSGGSSFISSFFHRSVANALALPFDLTMTSPEVRRNDPASPSHLAPAECARCRLVGTCEPKSMTAASLLTLAPSSFQQNDDECIQQNPNSDNEGKRLHHVCLTCDDCGAALIPRRSTTDEGYRMLSGYCVCGFFTSCPA